MAKRLTDTDIWNQDWFIDLSRDHKIFWMFLKDDCDYAGVWSPNISIFKKVHKIRLELKEALEALNQEKERVIVLKNGKWFLRQFIFFQYGGTLNPKNGVHRQVLGILCKNGVSLSWSYPQVSTVGDTLGTRVEPTDKEQDQDKEKKGVLGENIGTWREGRNGRGAR